MELNLKNLLLASVGSVAYAIEKSSDVIDDMVNKGQLTVDQGKQLNQELKNKFMGGGAGTSGAKTSEVVQEIISTINPATKEDIARLEARITQLEQQPPPQQ